MFIRIRRIAALALILFCYAGWGSGMVAMKIALQSFSPLQIMTARVAVPGIFYLLLWPRWSLRSIGREDIKYFILMACCEPCLFFFCVTIAMRYTSAGEGSVISACLPLFVAAGAHFFLGENFSRKSLLWLLCAVAAVLGLNYFSVVSSAAPNPLPGNCLMLAGIVFSAVYTLLARKLAHTYSGLLISTVQAFTGCMTFIPLCLMQNWPESVETEAWLTLIWLALGIGLLVYLAYNIAMRYVKASVAGVLANLTPLVGLVLAWCILGEQMDRAQIICAAIALVATAFAGRTLAKNSSVFRKFGQ